MKNGFTLFELIIVMAIIGILAALIIPPNNFSYIAASIITDSQRASEPIKKEIEEYYLTNNKFPDSQGLIVSLNNMNKPQKVKSIQLLSNGQVRIIYNTADIKWGSTWWHSWNNPLSNDLTGKDLIMVPTFDGKKLVWDDCNFGSVPKRNRNYKCSQHK